AGNVNSSGCESESGQRDHRVASPVREPGVSGDDRGHGSAASQELIGGARKDAGVWRRSFADCAGAGGGHHGCGAIRRQFKRQGARAEEIFTKIQAALALERIFKVEIPLVFGRQTSRVVSEKEARQPGIWLNRKLAGVFNESGIQCAVGVSKVV